jgi:hypothetical protein
LFCVLCHVLCCVLFSVLRHVLPVQQHACAAVLLYGQNRTLARCSVSCWCLVLRNTGLCVLLLSHPHLDPRPRPGPGTCPAQARPPPWPTRVLLCCCTGRTAR